MNGRSCRAILITIFSLQPYKALAVGRQSLRRKSGLNSRLPSCSTGIHGSLSPRYPVVRRERRPEGRKKVYKDADRQV